MSVSQVKKRITELREYLNRDKEGIKRLDLVKDEVTELRKSLAAANAATQLAQTIKDAARERADVAEAALQEAQLEIHTLRQKTNSLMYDLEVVTRVEPAVEEEELTPDKERSAMRIVMRSLRKKLRYCPEAIGAFGPIGQTAPIFAREDIAKGWSHESVWTLGAAAAVLTATMGRFAIYGDKSLLHRVHAGENSGTSRHAYEWLAHHNDSDRSEDDVLRTAMIKEKQKQYNSKGVILDSR